MNRLAFRMVWQSAVAALVIITLFLILFSVLDPVVADSGFSACQRLMTTQTVILVVLLTAVILLLVYRNILRPFDRFLRMADEISKGNIDLEIPHADPVGLGLITRRFKTIVQDLKAREKEIAETQHGLTESELKFRSITSSALDAIVMVDNDGRVTYWNEAAEKIFGYSAEDIMHRELYRVLIPERFHQTYREKFPDFKHGGGGTIFGRALELTAVKKDGTELPIEVSLSTVLLQNKWNATGILRDNTRRKQDEIELQKYREQLEEMVLERTRELKAVQDELVNKAIESGRVQLSAMILHNIGNALTPVSVQVEELMKDDQKRLIGYIEKCYQDLLKNRDGLTEYVNKSARGQEIFTFMGTLIDSVNAQVADNVKAIRKIFSAVSYMGEIISLQQSYASSGRETRELVNLNLLLEDSIRMQQSSLEKRRITIEKDLAKNLPLLKIDKNKLMQVIVNLIKNSYEAIDALKDPDGEKRISFRTFREKAEVGFEIADSGIGIEPEKIKTMFGFGESAKGSSGFGLYYSKMFVESNQGVLEFTSAGVGQGALVRVRFQRSENNDKPQQAT
ncbi:PAS domain S-box protein [bacterium]|nr:PAS domain S-box protein [bacterium]